ncbi:hypothetical protein GAYE_SCF61G6517 [Galdieria yellowstonensis]|uniref:Uncharacterized protein n=1 Tax=Galdieria yellowstonensis TaxID=3028027 RepID=A0AAV9IMP9_9RHOD|nr:hypothetical protein GAYE_SCF61G6517 [Galdieria yellowstonensis]
MSDSDRTQQKEQACSSEERKPRKKRAPPGEFDRQVEAVRKEMQAIKESLEETERKLQEAERLRNLHGSESKEEEGDAQQTGTSSEQLKR